MADEVPGFARLEALQGDFERAVRAGLDRVGWLLGASVIRAIAVEVTRLHLELATALVEGCEED